MEKVVLLIAGITLWLLQVNAGGPSPSIIIDQCVSTDLLFRVEANPSSTTVDALNDVTLTCQTSSPLIMPSQYSWFRINGDIPSSSSGQNTNTLTLRNVVSADEGEYYCIAALSRHCARSNNVMVSVRVTCPSLSNPSNGMINCSLGDDKVPSYEDTCNFTCDTGYELTGSETRTCQSNGTWSGSIAMCISVATIFFNQSTYAVNETDRAVAVTLVLRIPSSTDITVQISDNQNTATKGLDYDLSGPYNVTIPSGNTTVVLRIPIIDDNVLEKNEDFNLIILPESLPSDIGLGKPNAAKITIIEDDTLTVQFSQVSYSGSELSGLVVTLLLRGGTSSYDISVTVMPSDQSPVSAEGGVDYDSNPINATFTTGSSNTTVTIPVTKDNIVEESETFDLTFTIPSSLKGQVLPGNITNAVGNIIDNSTTEVEFKAKTITVKEDIGLVEITVFLSNPLSSIITFEVYGTDVTATGGGVDYDSGPYTVIISAKEETGFFNVSITNDSLLEESELFNLVINSSSLPSRVTTDVNKVNVTITDNDVLSVEFDQMVYSGSEESGIISVTLSLKGGTSSYDISVTVMPSDQSPVSAEGGVDYDFTAITATFTTGSTSTTVNVPVTEDNIVEESEKFNLTLSIPSSLKDQVILGDVTDAVGNIIDNTTTEVRFDGIVNVIDEGSGLAQIFVFLSNPLSSNITFEVYVTDITATGGGVDYDSGPYTVIIPAKKENGSISVSINDDDILEASELFRLVVNSSSLPSRVTTTFSSIIDIIILDNDALTVEFDQMVYSGSEASGAISVTLILKGGTSSYNISVTVITSDQSSAISAEGGEDYISGSYNVIFPAGEITSSFGVSIINDNVLESDEQFDISIDTTSLPDGITVGSTGSSTVTIMDDDVLTVQFSKPTFSGSEASGFVSVTLMLGAGTSASPITITVTPFDQSPVSAQGGVDYTSAPINATFPVETDITAIDIPVSKDDIIEEMETFNLNFSIPSSLSGKVILGNITTATGIIVDDSGNTMRFGQAMYSVNENDGIVQVMLNLSNPSSADTSVNVSSINQSANGGVDYKRGPYTVNFPAGITSILLNISITSDKILEINETFQLTIDPPSGITLVDPSTTTITIVDDDFATISFNQSMYSINENGGSVKPVLVLSNPSSTEITVQVIDEQDTAIGEGNDYVSGPYMIKFSPGQTRVEFEVPIMNDNTVESNETFMFALNLKLLPAKIIPANPDRATVTIIDNDVLAIQFYNSTFSGLESSGIISVTLILEGGTSASVITVTVQPFDQSPVSAQGNGTDYTSAPITATFSVGSTNITINVPVTRDNILEERESFNLNFSIPSSLRRQVIPGNITTATGIIIDDTNATVRFGQAMYTVDESDGVVEILLILSNPSSTISLITVFALDESAEEGFDFASGPYNVIFPPNTINASFNISITNDAILEKSETFTLNICPPDDFFVADPDEAVVTIVDDDRVLVSFNQSSYTVYENDEVLPVLTLSNPSSFDVTIRIRDTEGSAMRNTDYIPGPYNVTIPSGQTNSTFNISVIDNDEPENDKRFSLIIIRDSLMEGFVLRGSNRRITVNIVDDDKRISFEHEEYVINEGENLQPVLILSNPVSMPMIVEILSSSNGSATGGEDYNTGPFIVEFSAGMTRVPFNVSITTDSILEGNETFYLLINASTLPREVSVEDPGQTTVTIVDDDESAVFFDQSSYNIIEDATTVEIVLSLSSPLPDNISVQIIDNSNSADSGDDYKSGPYNVTFTAGMTTSSFSVSIIDDETFEDDETFILKINSAPSIIDIDDPRQAIVTIIDNEVILVQFSQSSYTGSEESGMVPVTLVLIGGTSPFPITVTVIPSNDSSISANGDGVDYNSTPINATFIVGSTNTTINVPVIKDSILEQSETFRLNFIIPSSIRSRVHPGSPSTATGNINDSNVLMVQFSQTIYSGSETSGSVHIMLLLRGGTSASDITVTVMLSDISAKGDGVDYTSTPIDATFTAGSTNTTISIPVTMDNLAEESETFNLRFTIPSSLSDKVVPGSITTANGTITDDTMISVNFSQSTYMVEENSGIVQFTVLLSNPSSSDIAVEVYSIDVATNGSNDYLSGSYPVKFVAEMTSASFNVSIRNDNLLELDEIFELVINTSSLPIDVTVGMPARATVTIVDDDNVAVSFNQSSYTVDENDELLPVLTLSNPSSFDVIIRIRDAEGSAKRNTDYIPGPYNVTIPSGQTNSTFNISVIDNDEPENDERFTLIIIRDSLMEGFVRGLNRRITVNIVDDDKRMSVVFFDQSSYSIIENATAVEIVLSLSSPLPDNISVQIIENSNSADSSDDYTSGPYNVTFTAGMITSLFSVSIIDDETFEDNETFTLKINSAPSIIDIGDPHQATVTIVDNEVILVQFSQSSYTGSEESGMVSVTLVLIGGTSPFPITVIVIPSNDSLISANGDGVDYNSTPINATFIAGSTNATINVPVIKDSILEKSETFRLNFVIPSSIRSRVHPGNLSTATGNIDDSNVLMVQFSQTTYSGSETSGSVHIMLLLRGGTSASDITVTVMLSDISAKGNGVDYTSTPIDATFTAGSTDTTISIPVTMDILAEESESFNLKFTIPSSLSGKVVPGNITTAIGTITDDTMISVNLSQSTYMVEENSGIVQFTVLLSNPSSSDIAVEVYSIDATTTGGNDYQSGSYPVKFVAEMISASFNVSIRNDNLLELDETFELVINTSSLPIDVTVGMPARATVTIVDDDIATVRFEQQIYIINEVVGKIQPVLILSHPSTTTITVQVFATDETANGSDYELEPYTVNFSPNMTRMGFDVLIIDDKLLEGNETFNLNINKSSLPESVTVDDRSQAKVTIVDDDAVTVTFNQSSYSVNEENEIARLTLLLSSPTSSNITIQLRNRPGTARRGSDYTGDRYRAIFFPGTTVTSFDINIVNDDIFENDKTFTVNIIANMLPNGISRGKIGTARVTIRDIAIVSFELPTLIVDENSKIARPSIVLLSDNLGRRSIGVEVFTIDGSATGNEDYASRPFSLRFIAGVAVFPLRIQINDDDTFEGNESFVLTIDSASLPDNVIINDPSRVDIIISDDSDAPTVRFEQNMYTVNENEVLEPALILTGLASIDVIVQVLTINGSAAGYSDRGSEPFLDGSGLTQLEIDDGDYAPGPYAITIKAGNLMAPFNISIIDDNIFEINESFNLSISSHGSIIVGDPDLAVVIIVDNDTPTVSFKSSSHIIDESDELVELVLMLSNPSSADIILQVLTTDGSATGYESDVPVMNILEGNEDYAHGPYAAVFPAGTSLAKISIPINNDNIFEGNENFSVFINSSSLASNKIFESIVQAIVTIIDDDPISISFNQSSYSVNETVGSLQALLVLSNPSSANMTVIVLSDDDTATGNDDYDPGPYNVSIIAGTINVPFKITIVDDIVLERNEKFMLTIDAPSLPMSVSIDEVNQSIVTIVEDDVATVMFEQETYTINETDKMALPVLVLSNQSSYAITVEVFSIDGSAIGFGSGFGSGNAMDFIPGPYIIQFNAKMTIVQFNVSINDDNIFERNETFNLGINASSLPKGVVVGNLGLSSVIILANDAATLSFTQSMYNINESDGQVQVILVLSNPSSTNIVVEVEDSNVTAIRGDDYDSGPYDVTFIAGMITSSFVISIIDDDAREDNESFILTINSSPVPVNDPNNVTVTIVDHDVIAVSFNESLYSTSESNGVVQIALMLSDVSSTSITVSIIIIDDSFIGSGDIAYNSTPYMVEFAAGMTSASFDIPIIDNNLSESNKNFTVAIVSSSLPNRVSVGDQDQVVVIIVDDDDVTVSFKNPKYSVKENDGTLQLVLVLSKPSSTDITIKVVNYDNTTMEGVDYKSGPYSVTFPAGQINSTFNVSIMDDDISEGNEYFDLSIDLSSLPIEVNTSNPAEVLVTIVDDEMISVSFKESSYNINENSNIPLKVFLILSEVSSMDITVRVTDDEGTAVGDDDYNSGPFSAIFRAGTTESSFDILIRDDKILEDNEVFLLKIESSFPPVGIIDEATVTIVDDDVGALFFSKTVFNVEENVGLIELELTLSNPSSNNITVKIENADKSAAGEDYVPGPYNATFFAGSNSSSFNIKIINDNVFERTEEFSLMFNPDLLPFNVIGIINQATVTIMDDDGGVRVSFNQSSYTVYENDEVLPVLTLSNPSSFDVSITIRDAGVTAMRNTDYIPGPYNVTIPSGQTNSTFNISVIDNDEPENDKTFNLIIIRDSLMEGFVRGSIRRTIVNIVDDDKRISFEHEEYVINEGENLQPVLILSNPVSMPMTIEVLSSSNGSATGGEDYNTGPFIVEFSAGMTRVPFNVSITTDSILEGNETFYLLINASTLPREVSVEDPGQTTVIIVDDDVLTIQFSNLTFSGLESTGIISVTLILEGGTSASVITVIVQPFDQSPVSAQGNGTDYTSAPITATFSVGSTNTTINVPVTRDDILEERETFNLNFSIPSSLSGQVVPGNITTATGIIIDDTNATVRFGQAMYTVDESDGVVEILLILSNPSSTILLITVFALDESAEEGFDFDSGPYNVIFPPNAINASFNILITNDTLLELNETFTLNICPPDDFFVIDPDEAVVTIVDDDTATISFHQLMYTANETDDRVELMLVLSDPSPVDIAIQVYGVEGSATAQDYLSEVYTIDLSAGSINETFSVTIIDDNILENDEAFSLIINATSLPDKVVVGDISRTTVMIVDDDVADISFSETAYSTTEDSGSVQPVLVLSIPSSFNITVQVTDKSSTAAGDIDYKSGPYSVIFSNGSTIALFDVPITNDNVLDVDEEFVLTIDQSSLPDNVMATDPTNSTVTIVDNELLTIRFSNSTFSGLESSGIISITLILEGGTSASVINVTVQPFNKSPASAQGGGVDFTFTPTTATFSAGSTNTTINITLSKDNILEKRETFDLNFKIPVLLRRQVIPGNITTATGIIIDDTNATVRFSQAMYTVDESNGVVQILLILSNPSSTTLNVTVFAADESANGGVDYDSGPYTVIFPPEMTNVSLNISITDDTSLEINETFTISINSSGDALPVDPDKALVTIKDNDGVNVLVGLNAKVGVDEQVIINCEPLIDTAEMANLMINWIHNDFPISNGSVPNVVISQNKRQCLITRTLLAVGGQLGNGGNYTCEICSDQDTCMSNSSIIDVCGEPNIALPSSPPMISQVFVSLRCGQNVTLPSSGVRTLAIWCEIFNGSRPLATKVFKDGVPINSSFLGFVINPFNVDDFGNYTFVVSSERCGSTAAVSWILPACNVTTINGSFRRLNNRRVSFTFSANDPQATYRCKIDDGQFMSCTSPLNLRRRVRVVRVRAFCLVNGKSESQISRTFRNTL